MCTQKQHTYEIQYKINTKNPVHTLHAHPSHSQITCLGRHCTNCLPWLQTLVRSPSSCQSVDSNPRSLAFQLSVRGLKPSFARLPVVSPWTQTLVRSPSSCQSVDSNPRSLAFQLSVRGLKTPYLVSVILPLSVPWSSSSFSQTRSKSPLLHAMPLMFSADGMREFSKMLTFQVKE